MLCAVFSRHFCESRTKSSFFSSDGYRGVRNSSTKPPGT